MSFNPMTSLWGRPIYQPNIRSNPPNILPNIRRNLPNIRNIPSPPNIIRSVPELANNAEAPANRIVPLWG